MSADDRPATTASAPAAPGELRCEICGAPGAHYVGYTFLVGAVVFWYMAGISRHVHCRRHILIHAIPAYVATTLFGWLGLSILIYPAALVAAAAPLRPVMGKAVHLLPVVSCALAGGAIFLLGRRWGWF